MSKEIVMNRRQAVALAAALGATSAISLSGCSNTSSGGSDHEPLTLMTYGVDYSAFEAALAEKYPEVKLEFVSYDGKDSTDYAYSQLKAGQITDIFAVSIPPYNKQLQVDNLIDLSAEDFLTRINLNLLSEVTVDGSVYMLPSNANFFGTYVNKTLFEKHGWEIPTSLNELEALLPKIQEAGVTVSECNAEFAGTCFAYLFDVSAPDFLTTLEGQQWVDDFLAGKEPATGHLDGSVATFKRLLDLGMFHVTGNKDAETGARFKEGNTAFLCANTAFASSQNDDGTGDQYQLIPYLSADGSNNIIVTKVNFHYGLSKELENNSQKLEDALKVMDFLATSEGQATLVKADNTYSPLKEDALSEDDPLYELGKMVDEGKSMPLIYAGWEDYVVAIGNYAQSFMKGELTEAELLSSIDAWQADVVASDGAPALATVEDDLEKEQAAQLVGMIFAKAVNADCALISLGDYHGPSLVNKDGENAKIFAGVDLDQNVVCTFNPLGWYGTISTATLTGKQINEWLEAGYLVEGDDTPFEYVLAKPEELELDDSKTYTIALTAESEERTAEGNVTATEVIGQDALCDYFEQLGTVNKDSIIWK